MWQTASDFLIFLGWAWQNISLILRDVFLPVRFIFTFLKQFFDSAFSPVVQPEPLWQFSDGIMGLFGTIPYFNTLLLVLLLALTTLISVFIVKTFLKS
jgi:hypothetical protein